METPLAKVRQSRGYSKAQAAKALNCDKAHWNNIEGAVVKKKTGKIHKPSPELAQRIVEHFNYEVTLQQLLFVEQFIGEEVGQAA